MKIPKGQSESVYRRRTDNTMTKRKRTKEQEEFEDTKGEIRILLTLPEHLSSPPVFSGVQVTRSLVLYVCFVDRCLSFCTFSFVVCSSLIYGLWLPFWYLQTLLVLLSFFFRSLCCLFFFDIRFWLPLWYLQTLLVLCPFSFGYCVVCSSSIYGL